MSDRAARIVELVSLADEAPTAAELEPYLDNADPDVRRAAVALLTEAAPADAPVALARRLLDADARVRYRATEGLRELREVIVVGDELRAALAAATHAADPVTRAAAVRLSREHGVLARDRALVIAGDADPGVRREVVSALVALD